MLFVMKFLTSWLCIYSWRKKKCFFYVRNELFDVELQIDKDMKHIRLFRLLSKCYKILFWIMCAMNVLTLKMKWNGFLRFSSSVIENNCPRNVVFFSTNRTKLLKDNILRQKKNFPLVTKDKLFRCSVDTKKYKMKTKLLLKYEH